MRRCTVISSLLIIILSLIVVVNYGYSETPYKPFEVNVSPFLPDNSFSWRLIKARSTNSYYAESDLPRFPLIDYEINVSANIGGHLGTPLVDGDLLVLAGWERIAVYNVTTGEMLWNREIMDEFGATIASYVLGDKIYVATEARFDSQGNAIPCLLLAFKRQQGELVWRVEVGSGGTDVTSNLVLVDGRLVFGTGWEDSKVYCYLTDGSLLWVTQLEGVGNIRGIAVGGATVFATGENGNNIYALNLINGKVKWVYVHDTIPGTPVYWKGRVLFIDTSGKLVCLDADSGKPIFMKEVGGFLDVDNNSRMAVSDDGDIYLARREETQAISKFNSEGELIATYNLNDVDMVGTPVISRRIILLPVTIRNGVKLLVFWDDLRFINELVWETTEGFVPTVSVSNASIFFVYGVSDGQRLVKLFDPMQPFFKNIEFPDSVYVGEPINVDITAVDGESGIYKAILFYRVDQVEIKSLEMNLLRRYVVEPAGGYGLNDEPYSVQIPPQSRESKVEFRILLVDNSGNYYLSEVRTVLVRSRPQPPIWLALPIVLAGVAAVYFLWIRRRS